MAVTTFSALLNSFNEDSNKVSWQWFLEESRRVRTLAQAVPPGDIQSRQAVLDPVIPKIQGKTFPNTQTGSSTVIGKMLLFQYDPKGKKTLPYYDMFPVVFPIEIYPDSFLGINLHYLPPQYRARLMDSLYTVAINKENLDEKMRLQISYKILKNASKFRFFKPCVKRYLYNHAQSRWSLIPPKNWDTVMMLPLQQFRGSTINTIWNDSIKIINKGK